MKKFMTLLILSAMLTSATACGKTADAAAEPSTDAAYIYGQIDSISGNDVVLLLADYKEEENSDVEADDGNEDNAQEDNDAERSDRKRPDFKGEKPEGFDPEKFKDGGMPEGSDPEKFKDGEMPEGFDPSKFKGGNRSENSKYTLTGEQKDVRIPVGTKVTTALGVETDFEVLTTGDIIKCSVMTDSSGQEIVTAVWIMEQ